MAARIKSNNAIELPRSRQDIADYVGLTIETVSRTLTTFENSAAIELLSSREVKERKDRVDDAMHATRAAVEEGILPGGGVALLRSVEALKRLNTENEDFVRKAIQMPARQIAINAGADGSVVVGKIMDKDQYSYGYDAPALYLPVHLTRHVILQAGAHGRLSLAHGLHGPQDA